MTVLGFTQNVKMTRSGSIYLTKYCRFSRASIIYLPGSRLLFGVFSKKLRHDPGGCVKSSSFSKLIYFTE